MSKTSVHGQHIAIAAQVFGARGINHLPQIKLNPPTVMLPHGQLYYTRVGYTLAADGTRGWVVSVMFSSGNRTWEVASTRGSVARSGEAFSSEGLKVFPSRRAMRHAKLLGII